MTLPEGYITMPIVRDKWACYTVGESLNNSLKWFDQKKKKNFWMLCSGDKNVWLYFIKSSNLLSVMVMVMFSFIVIFCLGSR